MNNSSNSKTKNSGQHNLDIDKALELLEKELVILKQLLYRNNNQHGKVAAVSYLKDFRRNMNILDSTCLCEIKNKSEEILRYGNNSTKMNLIDFNEMISFSILLYNIVDQLYNNLQKCLKSSQFFINQLASKVFAPLYTTLYALSARFYSCLSVVVVTFLDRFDTLQLKIKVFFCYYL